jgi:ribonuclease HI
MIKLWSEELKREVFDILADLWTSYSIPPYWRHRLLTLIPKSHLPQIDCFRPITLLETLRKLWTSITIHRITNTCAQGGYLHHSQHGCLKKVGVDEANLGLLNQYESAKELTSELYTIAWDLKHAFDRPTKPSLLYAWIRIGVPQEIANYLVQLGIGGHSLIKTPLVTKAMLQVNTSELEQQYFTQETGTSQGDNQASISFNCVTDILLVALSKARLNPTAFHTHDGECIDQESSAYVDDITSLHGTIEGLQREADIISAYCQLFGLDLSLHKLKAYRLQWGNAHIPGADHVLIHSQCWTPYPLTLESDGTFKTLGMTVDANTTFHTQFEITKQNALTGTKLILKAPISVESKIIALKSSLIPKLQFAAKYAAWPLAQYHEIDQILERAYRTIAHCMPSHPKALLYMKLTDGGLGLPKFSLECSICKLRLLMRMSQSNEYRRSIASSLIARGARAQGIVIPIGHGALINTPLQLVWLTSLLQELHDRHLHLYIHGRRALEDIYHWQVTPPGRNQLATLATNADIGISTKEEADATTTNIPLRTAQVWEVTQQTQTSIKEIISFSGPHIEYMEWKAAQPIITGTLLTLSTTNNPISSYPIGAHGTHKALYDDFFPPTCQTKLLILSAEAHNPDRLHITCKVKHTKQKTPTRMQPFNPSMVLIEQLQTIGQHATHIFTDGSYNPSLLSATGGGAVIFKQNKSKYQCIKIQMDMGCSSVFPLELCALAVARVAASTASPTCNIYTDSKASLDVMTSIDAGDIQKSLITFYLNQPSLYSNRKMNWVKSHVEDSKAKNFSAWTEAERGNYIADKMASHGQADSTPGPPTIIRLDHDITITTVLVIGLSTIIDMFMQFNPFSVWSLQQPFVEKLKDLHLRDMSSQYLVTRDTYRNKRRPGLPPKPFWTLRHTHILAWTNRNNPSLRENSLRSRIIYNKSWTTSNQYKYGVTATREPCPCCNSGFETQNHIILECTHPVMEHTRNELALTINEFIRVQRTTYPHLADIILYIHECAFNGTSNGIWTGLWSPELYETITNKISKHATEGPPLMPTVAHLTRIYTDAAKELYIARSQIRTDPALTANLAGTHIAIEKITSYFKLDMKKKPKKTATKHKPSAQTGPEKTPTTGQLRHVQNPARNPRIDTAHDISTQVMDTQAGRQVRLSPNNNSPLHTHKTDTRINTTENNNTHRYTTTTHEHRCISQPIHHIIENYIYSPNFKPRATATPPTEQGPKTHHTKKRIEPKHNPYHQIHVAPAINATSTTTSPHTRPRETNLPTNPTTRTHRKNIATLVEPPHTDSTPFLHINTYSPSPPTLTDGQAPPPPHENVQTDPLLWPREGVG